MSRLVVVAYPQEYRAEEVLDTLTRLGRENLADLNDAWYVSRSGDGRLRLHRPVELPAPGDASDAAWNALLGSACLYPVLDAEDSSGTAVAGRALVEARVSARFVHDLGKALVPESSAIVALIRRVALDEVLPELALYGGTVMQTSLAPAPGAGR
jgi:uncharacterized membrane protein